MKPKWEQTDVCGQTRIDGPCEMCVDYFITPESVPWAWSVVITIETAPNYVDSTYIAKRGRAKSLHAAKCAAVKAAWELSHMLKDTVWLRAVHNAEGKK